MKKEIYLQNKFSTNQITISLIYENNYESKLLDSSFCFSIPADACFDEFTAQIGDKIVKGDIKEKQQAQKDYDEGKKAGKTMVITTIDPDLKDVVKVTLGNVEPKEQITINLRYLQSLSAQDGCCRILLPFTLYPRYKQNNNYYYNQNYIDQHTYTDKELYGWIIDIELSSNDNNIIKDLKCHSHGLDHIVQQDDLGFLSKNSFEKAQGNNLKMRFNLSSPKEDFNLTFNLQNPYNTILQKNLRDDEENKYCAMVSIKNDFKQVKEISDPLQPQEYIFILDRSGSMSGSRIQLAVESLIQVISQLPEKSYYNIISFGTKFETLYPISRRAYKENIQKSVEEIQTMQANFGGTNIAQPLEYAYENLNYIKGYARNIFLITDGDVGDGKSLVNFVEKRNRKASLFTLGIGSGTSQVLIVELATKGNGLYEFVNNNDQIKKSMNKLLETTYKKKFTNFELKYDCNKVKALVPDINQLSFIREDETLQCFFLLEDGFDQLDIELLINGKQVKKQIITQNEAVEGSILHKMANYQLIKKYIENTMCEGDVFDDIYVQRQADMESLKQQAIDLSVKYQILCELTAFICEVKTIKDEISQQNLQTKNIDVPSITSQLNQVQSQINSNIDALIERSNTLQACNQSIQLSSIQFQKCSQMKKKSSCCDVGGGPILLPGLYDKQVQTNQKNLKNKKEVLQLLQQKFEQLLDYEMEKNNDQNSNLTLSEQKNIVYLLKKQNNQGFWEFDAQILKMIQFMSFIEQLDNLQENKFILYNLLILSYLNEKKKTNHSVYLAINQAKKFFQFDD
ncbi:hypothetical protein PPERSA_06835 [Pseudocohnilembus persalinus]|uniref:Uncharacterized protein n=1 Tax=Pseudocohnilembus persalinus TaxID=266149 RepID=A0A0V0QSN6_PSEPJ|nr:hypothetical protein PPERSA_06835 [Pseudocohnilembus persalinus]|eukprot:KRX05201.1 hypothetical protein PPERSA_06835 [Pseudocohnilembus persalinus]